MTNTGNTSQTTTDTALLELRELTKFFGGVCAVSDLDLELFSGEILGLIGPNGAGKTTAFNMITGIYRPSRGTVVFDGRDITGLRPDVITRHGISRTFQATSLFHEFSALKNVTIGLHLHYRTGFWRTLLATPFHRREEMESEQRALEMLELVGIAGLKDELARNLPHGHQRALGIAIALAANPKVLLLDEPVTGMNPEETAAMMARIQQIREQREVSILLVEHDMKTVMGLCDRITVLNFGQKIAEGSPQEIRENKAVIEAYLGAGDHA